MQSFGSLCRRCGRIMTIVFDCTNVRRFTRTTWIRFLRIKHINENQIRYYRTLLATRAYAVDDKTDDIITQCLAAQKTLLLAC